MSDEGVTAVVDVHEPEYLRMYSLAHEEIGEWTEHQLAASDMVIEGIGFERKTPADFAASMTEGRLDDQRDKLLDGFETAYILLEGTFGAFDDLEHSSLNPQSAKGMAASLTARHGIPVIPTGLPEPRNSQDSRHRHIQATVDHAVRLARKHTEEPVSSHLPTGDVGSSEPPAKQMWGCLSGIGPSRAERLYDEFGSPAEFVDDLARDSQFGLDGEWRERLTRVDGIGDATAETIVKELRGDD